MGGGGWDGVAILGFTFVSDKVCVCVCMCGVCACVCVCMHACVFVGVWVCECLYECIVSKQGTFRLRLDLDGIQSP